MSANLGGATPVPSNALNRLKSQVARERRERESRKNKPKVTITPKPPTVVRSDNSGTPIPKNALNRLKFQVANEKARREGTFGTSINPAERSSNINVIQDDSILRNSGATGIRGLDANISEGRPSIRTPDGQILTLDDENLTLEQQEALQIIFGQQSVTKNLAQQIADRRRAALLLGATQSEAQEFAVSGQSFFKGQQVGEVEDVFTNEKGEFGLGKQSAKRINTALQQKQIRRNEARLESAEVAISNQTTDGEAGDLDNLKQILKTTPNQDKPISDIDVSTDREGNVISPRNVRLQTENALLTGIDPENFSIDVKGSNTPNAQQINQIIREAAEGVLLNAELPSELVTVQTGVDGESIVDFAPDIPEILQQETAEQISNDIAGAFGATSEQRNQIKEDILNGELINFGEIIPNFPEIAGSGSKSGGSDLVDQVTSNPLLLIGIIGSGLLAGIVLLNRRKK